MNYAGRMGIKPEQSADKCIECEKCLELCSQKIEIPQWLKKAHQQLTPKN